MGKQKLDRIKKTLAILLVVLFVLSVTATAINAKATLEGKNVTANRTTGIVVVAEKTTGYEAGTNTTDVTTNKTPNSVGNAMAGTNSVFFTFNNTSSKE